MEQVLDIHGNNISKILEFHNLLEEKTSAKTGLIRKTLKVSSIKKHFVNPLVH